MRRICIAQTAALSAALAVALVCAAPAGEPEALVPTGPQLETGIPLGETAAAPEVHLNLIDQKLALSLAVDTQGQIDMANFALESVTSDAVRQFATVRLESQQDFAAELNALTKGRTRSTLARARREIEADRAPDKVPQKRFRLLSIRSATALLARIRLEILQEYAALQQQALAAKSAGEFDRHYLRSDLLNQMQTLATLKVFESQASDDFAQVIHRAWARTHEQFESAKQLLLQLETATLAGVAPSPPELVENNPEP